MAFSYDEWKKADDKRKKPSVSAPVFSEWSKNRRSSVPMLQQGLDDPNGISTYDEYKASQWQSDYRGLGMPRPGIFPGSGYTTPTGRTPIRFPSSHESIAEGILSRTGRGKEDKKEKESAKKEEKKTERKMTSMDGFRTYTTPAGGTPIKFPLRYSMTGEPVSREEHEAKKAVKKIEKEQKKSNSNYDEINSQAARAIKALGRGVANFLDGDKDVKEGGIDGMGPLDAAFGIYRGLTKEDNNNDRFFEKFGSNLRAGAGDTLEGLGSAANYLGEKTSGSVSNVAKDVGKGLNIDGSRVKKGFDDETYGKEFTWKNVLDPDFYSTTVARAVPQLGATILPGLGVAGAIKGATALTKLPNLARTIIGAAGGAGATTSIESAMIAGGVYDEAKRRGWRDEEAEAAADEAFKKNLALTGGTTFGEFALGMTPLGRTLSRFGTAAQIGGRTLGGAGLEAFQEGYQAKIEADALGDDFSWRDPKTIEAMVVGGILGGGMTGAMSGYQAAKEARDGSVTRAAGDIINDNPIDDITQRVIDRLDPDVRERFDSTVSDIREQRGVSFRDAQLEALETLSKQDPEITRRVGQEARSWIENKKLERQASKLNDVNAMERELKAQEARNTAQADSPFEIGASEYQLNLDALNQDAPQAPGAPDITSATAQTEPAKPTDAPKIDLTATQAPQVEALLSQLNQLRQQPAQNNSLTPPAAQPVSPAFGPILPEMPVAQAPQAQQAQASADPLNMMAEQASMPSEVAPAPDQPVVTEELQALAEMQENMPAEGQPTENVTVVGPEAAAPGDAVQLKGTRANTEYIVESVSDNNVSLQSPTGRIINVKKSAISRVLKRDAEQMDSDVPPEITEALQQYVVQDGMTAEEATEAVKDDLRDFPETHELVDAEANRLFSDETDDSPTEQTEKEAETAAPETEVEAESDVTPVDETEAKTETEPEADEKPKASDSEISATAKEIVTSENKDEGSTEEAAEKPKEPAEESTPVEAQSTDRVPPKSPMQRILWMRKKMSNMDYTAAEIKEQFEWLVANEKEIKAEMLKQINNSDAHKRKRKSTKVEMVKKQYKMAKERLAYADKDMLSYRPTNIFGSPEESAREQEEQLREQIMSVTDESIQAHLDVKREQKAAIKNPTTLKDYARAKAYRELTAEEQAEYDRLRALDKRENDKKAVEEAPKKAVSVSKGDYIITPDKDTRDNSDIWVVKLKEKVDGAAFKEVTKTMKAAGGYYSRFKKGFIFKSDPTDKLTGEVSETAETEDAPTGRDPKHIAEKLRTTAANMQKSIDDKRSDDRLTNTARRAAQDASMREEADRLERQQRIMNRIADAIESGEATFLDNVTARTHIETLDGVLREIRRDRIAKREAEAQEKNPQRNFHLSPDERNKIDREPYTDAEINELDMPKPMVSVFWLDKVLKANAGTKGLGRVAQRLNAAINRLDKKEFTNDRINGDSYRDEIMKLTDYAIKNDKERYFAEYIRNAFNTTKRLEAMKLDDISLLRSAIREYIKYVEDVGENVEQKRKDAKRKAEAELSQAKIEGFFPTPVHIVDRMLEEAGIEPGMKVLEPSAGKGNIAERIRENTPDAALDVVEFNTSLHNYLKEQDFHVVDSDFMAYEDAGYNRIVMNPPFEKGQDIDHVRHAYDLLLPGGRIVAIMSEGPFFRGDKKAESFREWLDDLGGVSEQLPANSFKDSERSTGVATRLVVIDKPFENDRDTFVIERVDEEPFVVKRGDKVLQFISNNSDMKEVTVKSISQTKKEINGTHYGSFYPLDYDSVAGKKKAQDRLAEASKQKEERKSNKGNGVTYTEAGTEIHFRYEVVDAGELVASNSTDMKVNPDYPKELQPRDRSRKASEMQIQTMAQKLNPALLGESAKASDGAPIVSEDMTVESGNGRTIAIQKMYEEGYDSRDMYRQFLRNSAERLGLDAERIENMESPVLVRVRTNEVDRQTFVKEANVSNVAAMSPMEQAASDSQEMTNSVMSLFEPLENGDLNNAGNRPFIAQFLNSVVPKNEQAALLTNDGQLNQVGLRRVQNAVLAKAYGVNESLLLMIESTDNNVKTITNAMLQAAPSIAIMKEEIAQGMVYNEDITSDLAAAVTKFSELRREGSKVNEYLNQTSLFDDGLSNVSKEFLNLFESGVMMDGKLRKSTKAYKSLLDTYTEVLQAAGNPNQLGLFNDNPPTKEELFATAIKKVTVSEDGIQTSIFENESESDARAGAPTKQTAKSNKDTFVSPAARREQDVNVTEGETTRAQILSHISKEFNVVMGVGKFREKAKGIYKNKFGIIRTKDYGDFEVIAHELGHRFDTRFGWSSDPDLKQELISFAEANLDIPDSMPPFRRAREGAAEYFRQFLYNESGANQSYETLSEALQSRITSDLQKQKWWVPLQKLQNMTTDWMGRTPEQEARGVVVSTRQAQKEYRTLTERFDSIYTLFWNRDHPIYRVMQRVRKETGKELPNDQNAYQLAVLTRGSVARAATFIEGYTFDEYGAKNGESLEAILNDVEDVTEFDDYLMARHEMQLYKERGKDFKMAFTPALAQQLVDAGNVKYKEHAKRIYAYQERLLQVLVDAGVLSEEAADVFKEKYPYYVPAQRVMTDNGKPGRRNGSGRRQYANQSQGVRRRNEGGSTRDYISPIESIVRNTHLYLGIADRNRVGAALASLADPENEFASEVAGSIIEKIPAGLRAMEGKLKDIQKSLVEAGLDEEVLETLDMEKTFKKFEQIFRANEHEQELLVWEDGKPNLYKVHDVPLYQSLVAMDNQKVNMIMNTLGKPAAAVNHIKRMGIVWSPLFTVTQFYRGVMQGLVKTDATGPAYFLKYMYEVGKSYKDVVKKNDVMYDWWASGGAQSTFISVETKYLEKEMDSMRLNRKAKAYLNRKYTPKNREERRTIQRHMAKMLVMYAPNKLQKFNDVFDQALKLAEYNVVKKNTGNRQQAAVQSRDADLDFKRFGKATREFNQVTLFFNPALQGPDNLARTWNKHKVRTTLRGFLWLTVPTILLAMMNYDDEEYQELQSFEKDLNWNIPKGNGEFYRLRIPFEYGVVFKMLPEKLTLQALDAMSGEDKTSWKDFGKNMKDTMLPSYVPTIFDILFSYQFEKSNMFGGIDYVPMALQRKSDPQQYDETTSEIMKKAGELLDKSPIVLEKTFVNLFSQIGQTALWATDKAAVGLGLADRPDLGDAKRGYIDKYFTASVNDSSTASVSSFYEELERLEEDYADSGVKYNVPPELKAYRKANDALRDMRKLRDAVIFDRITDASGGNFTTEEKKEYADMLNKAIRDGSRKVQGKDPLDEQNFENALSAMEDFRSFMKAEEKKARKAAKQNQ